MKFKRKIEFECFYCPPEHNEDFPHMFSTKKWKAYESKDNEKEFTRVRVRAKCDRCGRTTGRYITLAQMFEIIMTEEAS